MVKSNITFQIENYSTKFKNIWDNFITNSKNGTFLFYRDYMEYHSDRFTDNSLLFFIDDRLIAVMPANVEGDVMYSHGGLTYGGIVTDHKMTTSIMIDIVSALTEYCRNHGIKKVIYKAIPHIYHILPAEEDLYALFRFRAKLIRRDISSAISLNNPIKYVKGRKYGISVSKKNNVQISQSYDFTTFMAIEEDNLLSKYGVSPVHTPNEIALLATRFPDNIKLFIASIDQRMIAGAIIFDHRTLAHTQYIAADDFGKKIGAGDFLLDYLIRKYGNKKYFSFGISTENKGLYLNEGLIAYKEGFGGRGVVHDFYEFTIP